MILSNHRYAASLFAVLLLAGSYLSADAATREYWIAAEKVAWNYAPSGKNLINPEHSMDLWGHDLTYSKYRYIEYTDNQYNKQVEQPRWMGILGPQLRAVEGDTLVVHFLNRSDKALSIHPHGVLYDKANEGADGNGEGAAVTPGKSFTYRWEADENSAPGPNDPSSIVWTYHSHVDSVTEIYDGLIGTLVITKKGMERSTQDPRPKDVDIAFTNMFMVFNENGRGIINSHNEGEGLSGEELEEGNLKHAMNGFIFGNLQGFNAKRGQKIRWHLLAMGTEVDLHTAHWHGQTVLENGHRTDVVELLPTSMKSVDMTASNPGDWLFHCHVTDHITAGMMTRWHVSD